MSWNLQSKMLDISAILRQRQQTNGNSGQSLPEQESQDSFVSSIDESWDDSEQPVDNITSETKRIVSNSPEGHDTFCKQHLHYLFTLDIVNIIWLDRDAEESKYQIMKYPPAKLLKSITGEFQSLCTRQSTRNVANRYLFYVLSLSADLKTRYIVQRILLREIESDVHTWHVPCSDFTAVILNFGASTQKFKREDKELLLPSCIEDPATKYASTKQPEQDFPLSNLKAVLEIVAHSLEHRPRAYRHEEKQQLLSTLLVIAGSKGIMQHCAIVQVIRNCIKKLLQCYTEDEWAYQEWRKVEDLVVACNLLEIANFEDLLWKLDLFSVGTYRAKQLQSAAAFVALRKAIGCEILIQGFVQISDVVAVAGKFESPEKLNENIPLAYELTRLLALAVNTNLATDERQRDALQEIATLLWKWKHCIFEQDENTLVDRHDVKNLMTQIPTSWGSFLPARTIYNL